MVGPAAGQRDAPNPRLLCTPPAAAGSRAVSHSGCIVPGSESCRAQEKLGRDVAGKVAGVEQGSVLAVSNHPS